MVKKIILIVFIVIQISMVYSQMTIIAASEEWEDCTNADGTGLYWEILNKVFEGYKVDHELVPYTRSVEMVKSKDADLYVASYYEETDGVLYPPKDLFFDADVVNAVYKAGNKLTDQKDLEGKTVGWMRGYGYDEYLTVEVKMYEVDKRETSLLMVKNDRLDFFLDAQVELDNLDASLFEGLETKKILELPLYFAFADNEKGRKLLEIYSKNFKKMIEDGTLKKMFEEAEFDYLW